MSEVEAQQAEDQDAQDGHVLGAPAVVLGLGGNLVTLDAAALDIVLDGEPDAIDDMEDEAQRQDGNHDADETGGHEIAAQLEQAVSGREQAIVLSNTVEGAVERIQDGEEIDGAVQEQEDDQESAGDALDELLADGGGQEISHISLV